MTYFPIVSFVYWLVPQSLNEDLRCWIQVLEKIDMVLSFVVEKIHLQNYAFYDSLAYSEVKYIAISVLRFLSSLMNCSKDKRFFMSFEVRSSYVFLIFYKPV